MNINMHLQKYLPGLGEVTLRRITFSDLLFTERLLKDSTLSDRDLTISLLQHQLVALDLTDGVSCWSDEDIFDLVAALLQDSVVDVTATKFSSFADVIKEVRRTFEQCSSPFSQVTKNIEEIQRPLKEVAQTINNVTRPLKDAINIINYTMEDFAKKIKASLLEIAQSAVGQVFQSLPDLSRVIRRQEGKRILAEGEYGFSEPMLNAECFARYAGMPAKVRPALITNAVRTLTASQDFFNQMEGTFLVSRLLAKRWKIVEQILLAHRTRNYVLAIPAALAQVEGLINELLIIKDMACYKNGKLYDKDENGNLRLGKKGNPIELKGICSKVDRSPLREHPVFTKVAEFLTSQVAPDRNFILHGSKVSYGNAKSSTQSILLMFLLAHEIAILSQ